MAPHLWQLENIVRDEMGRIVEYDKRCARCQTIVHVAPPDPEECPGYPPEGP